MPLLCFYTLLLVLLVISVKSAYSANILYVGAVPSPSHHIWNRALAFGLANKGHNVTYISPDDDRIIKPQNYTHILLEGVYEELRKGVDINEMPYYGPTQMIIKFEERCLLQCELYIKTKGIHTLLNYPKDFKFDVIIIDITVGSCLYPLIHKFNYPPTVAVSAFLLPQYVSYTMGNNLFPSYIPWFGLPYTTEMTFVERVWNFLYTYATVGVRHIYQYKREHKTAKKVFGDNIPSMEELESHISLVLSNTDPIMDHSQPITPNIIPVGGLHTRKSGELPQNLQKIVDHAENGVIVMSLGTNIRFDKLPKETLRAILEAFSKLKETVIWKFETNIKEVPKNVIIQKWLPQNDILGHPNVKLFIGHGGALSTQETFFHGVPVIVIPFIVDQYINSRIIVNRKLGVKIDFRNITTENFLSQLREVLDNPIYSENVKKLSRLLKDRPETPLEKGIFWIEYVVRNGGTHFLNPVARKLPFYKIASFDVILFLLTVVYVTIYILTTIISMILRLLTAKEKVKMQ